MMKMTGDSRPRRPAAFAAMLALWGSALAAQAANSPAVPAHPLDCVLEPYEEVEVSSAVKGVIKNIHVDRNDLVSQGQLLVELDSEVERTQVALAKARAGMQTGIELRETELAFSLRNEQRLDQLYKTDTVSLHLKDEAETDSRKSRLQLRSAKEEKRLAELELAQAEAVLALRSMHSPISGVVVARNKVAGEYVEDQSILRIAQLNPLKVEVIAPVEMFGTITTGMQVQVTPEHARAEPRYATITMVDRMIDPASGTFDVRAELPNPDMAIPSGLRCTVEFLEAGVKAPAAPERASERFESAANADTKPEAVEAETAATESFAVVHSGLVDEDPRSVHAHPAILDDPPHEPRPQVEPAVVADFTDAGEQPFTESPDHCESEIEDAKTSYAVLANPAENASASDKLAAELRDRGIEDFYLLRQGPWRGQVSLGVYSKLENARQRQLDIADQGFNVAVVDRLREMRRLECERTRQLAEN